MTPDRFGEPSIKSFHIPFTFHFTAMGILQRFRGAGHSNEKGTDATESHRPPGADEHADLEKEAGEPLDNSHVRIFTVRVFLMGIIVSIGGLIFGYDTGQISGMFVAYSDTKKLSHAIFSGFLEMPNFLNTFADTTKNGRPAFSNSRSGTIVGLLSIGTLIGALVAAPIADKFGRRYSIVFWNLIFCVGLIVQITTDTKWYQLALGRWVAGLGVG
jgi:SP family sugar:H+ symporter-like MFS transporter